MLSRDMLLLAALQPDRESDLRRLPVNDVMLAVASGHRSPSVRHHARWILALHANQPPHCTTLTVAQRHRQFWRPLAKSIQSQEHAYDGETLSVILRLAPAVNCTVSELLQTARAVSARNLIARNLSGRHLPEWPG